MTIADITVADGAILALVATSALVGVLRGLVRELFSLGGWIAAFVVAGIAGPVLAAELAPWITVAGLRTPIGFLGAFIVTLMIATLVGRLLQSLLAAVGLGGFDRLLGGLFGSVRGVLIVVVVVVALRPFAHTAAWWQESLLVGAALGIEHEVLEVLGGVRSALGW